MIWAFIALLAGGILKGATGAGAPIIAVPVIALLYDVPFAIVMFSFPNLLSNLWQGWQYRDHQMGEGFTWRFAVAGAIGAGLGTVILANVPSDLLVALVAMSVFVYIGFRLARPDWFLPFSLARRIVWPVGTLAGMMQGAGGVSAPVSITFLNAMKPERAAFVGTVSVFFVAMAAIQIPLLAWYGFLDWHRLGLSLLALLPILGGMPIGAALAKRLSKQVFDRLILTLLALVALRLLIEVTL
ncbi:sulfite exporter TauE/SafE family protein [Mesobaculum littorinae]|uniref:Probable membrane transporter protein n=1 Tax=Mesobaculum littorinae TaxID=2486419 RepID=A0A438ALI4_9RHOB|nr:sulfite exporter TauE/SafE family protein [Mesobaculum littorinae]RVV99608.1 sulfite exporter TauE/SafE family protein [Mesobaculum littorinae]